MKARQKPKARGFGILEVLISSTMLVAGLAGVLQAQASITNTMARERRLTMATHIAEQTMERLLVLFPGDGELAGGSHTGLRFDDEGTPAAAGRFAARWTVNVGDPIAGTRRITVEVQWVDGSQDRVVALTTLRS